MIALDLFAGAGGFSLGLHLAGIKVAGAIEVDRFATETYRHNFPGVEHFQRAVEDCSDKWFRKRFQGIDLVVGGPPCQGFSVAGPSQYRKIDQRNSLILEMARVISNVRPKVVMMENVRGILSGKLRSGSRALDEYFGILNSLGYESRVYRVQAADFGVPQDRERVFVISAIRSSYSLPDRIEAHSTCKRITVDQAIGDLPRVTSGEGNDDLVPYPGLPRNNYQKAVRANSKGVSNHVAMYHSKRILDRLSAIQCGASLKDVAATHGQRRRDSSRLVSHKLYKMNYSRISGDLPSLSLPANFQTIHVHPHQHRMLTAREGARIQSFPDAFVFKGPRTLMSKKLLLREGRKDEIGLSQYNQIGNSVPPLMAKGVAEAILELTS